MYYARLIHYKLGANQRLIAERLTQDFDKISRKMTGFRGSVYFFDDPSGEYRALNYWDTKEEAERANKVLFPKLVLELQNYTQEKPTVKLVEVFEATNDDDIVKSHIKLW
ncbi:hypothetical protein MLOOGBEN_28865 [Bacillus sp. EB106-08-02-XG196]|jgi:hypothetical protein|uniref:hypothetical protein n=1 Tax=Bacillus sp. EB106-08-02-XG196 TaxID=2737049 RepID=UPI0015C467A1|nr:hypothetical protein [Bacillus sp. EB106-08-02-XG196]NWQ44692.1 hypothetical protein [Bacillus sp. EB106-08-02-XG196]